MIQTIKNNILAVLAIAVLSTVSLVALAPVAHGQSIDTKKETQCGSNISLAQTGCDNDVTAGGSGVQSLITRIINTLSVLVGAICVIMIIIGGFRYVTSAGESNSVSGAKNTILYAIVGLIIVAFAQIIVQFVLQRTTT